MSHQTSKSQSPSQRTHKPHKPKKRPVHVQSVMYTPTKDVFTSSNNHQVVTNVNNRFSPQLAVLPQVTVSPMFKIVRRYITNGAINGILTIQDLLKAFIVCTTPTNFTSLVECIRIKKILWLAPITTAGTPIALNITPIGNDTSDNSFTTRSESFTDTSVSFDHPAYVCIKPSITSPTGSWHYSTTVNKNLFEIFCPTGTTMDIHFEVVFSFSGPLQGYTTTSPLGTSGILGCQNILTSFLPAGVNGFV